MPPSMAWRRHRGSTLPYILNMDKAVSCFGETIAMHLHHQLLCGLEDESCACTRAIRHFLATTESAAMAFANDCTERLMAGGDDDLFIFLPRSIPFTAGRSGR